jgi:hypothetical protein
MYVIGIPDCFWKEGVGQKDFFLRNKDKVCLDLTDSSKTFSKPQAVYKYVGTHSRFIIIRLPKISD